MNTKTLIGLIIVSAIAILVDCYAGYGLFMMTAMWLGVDFTIPYFSAVFLLPIIFIVSIINLFRLKKWAYRTFLVMTTVLHSFLIYIYMSDLTKGLIKDLEIQQVFPMFSLSIFFIYFLRPSIRKLFH